MPESLQHIPFTDQSESYAHGFEAGALWIRLSGGNPQSFEWVTYEANRTVVQHMAHATDWTVLELESDGERATLQFSRSTVPGSGMVN